ncbi:MAG: hypothetical protein ACYTGW_02200 [Planctomycetota bacterium]
MSVKGHGTVDGNSAPIDMNFSDILDVVDDFDVLGLAGRMEAWKGDWALFLNADYIELGGEDELAGLLTIEPDIHHLNADLGVIHRLCEIPLDDDRVLAVEPLGGVRYVYLKQEMNLTPGPLIGTSNDYIEPFVGARVALRLNEQWGFGVRSDVGGFGIGSASERTWSVLGTVNYQWSEKTMFQLGYRYWSYDFERGSGTDENGLDVQIHGPWIAMTRRF